MMTAQRMWEALAAHRAALVTHDGGQEGTAHTLETLADLIEVLVHGYLPMHGKGTQARPRHPLDAMLREEAHLRLLVAKGEPGADVRLAEHAAAVTAGLRMLEEMATWDP